MTGPCDICGLPCLRQESSVWLGYDTCDPCEELLMRHQRLRLRVVA